MYVVLGKSRFRNETKAASCGGIENPKAETSQVTHTGAQIPENESTEVDYIYYKCAQSA